MRRKRILVLLGGIIVALSLLVTGAVSLLITPNIRRPPPIPYATPQAPDVVVDSQASVYQPTDTFRLTVTNQSKQVILFWDHQTGCSVLGIEIWTANRWQLVDECSLGIQSRQATLDPGQRLVVRIPAPAAGWQPGLYLAAFSYVFVHAPRPSRIASYSTFHVD